MNPKWPEPANMSSCANCGHQSEQDVKFCPSCGTRVVTVEEQGDPLLGKTLSGKYRVISELGSGSMGTVYLGEHIGLKKKVALKVLHQDLHVSDESMKRFQREGIAAGSFSHPNAIQIFDFDRTDDKYIYLALEFVEGPTLKAYLKDTGPLSPLIAVRLIRQVLSTLAEAHSQGIIHRDLKPDNIMVVKNAAGELTVKVLDFGLSKLVDRPLDSSLQTQTGRIMGTPLYMSPEQWAGSEVDGRSDLYSVGLILYEMLSCHHPFRGNTITETMVKSTSQEAPSLTESRPELKIPVGLDEVLDRAMQKRRADRYESATQMIIDLDEIDFGMIAKADRSSGLRSSQSPAAAAEPKRAKSWLLAVAGISLALLGGWVMFSGVDLVSGPDLARASMKAPTDRSPEEVSYLKLLAEAQVELSERKFIPALGKVEAALASPVADSEGFLLRAMINRTRGQDDLAAVDLAKALALDQDYAEAAIELGWLHLDQDDLPLAEIQFQLAAEIADGLAPAQAGLGALAYRRKQYQVAKQLLTEATHAAAAKSRAYLYLGRCQLALRDVQGAIQSLLQAKLKDSHSWEAVAKLGEAYLDREESDLAEPQLRDAIRLDPVAATNAQGLLASLLVDQGRYGEASEILDPALRRHPEFGRLHILKGAALHGIGDRVAAIASLETGLASTPDPDAHVLLGLLYHEQGDGDGAAAQFRSALGIDGTHPLALLHLGLVRFTQGRYHDAGRHLGSAVDRDPNHAFARLCLGIYQMDFAEDASAALAQFEAYQALGGKDPRVEGWLEQLRR